MPQTRYTSSLLAIFSAFHHVASKLNHLIQYLQETLAVPGDGIALGLRQVGQATNLLPIVLWQYGLISTKQLDQVFDWIENA